MSESQKSAVEEIFGNVIYAYTRAQAIADGVLIDGNAGDLDEVSRQHFKYPIAMTAAVFAIIEAAVTNERYCNDYKGVWHDILWMSKANGRDLSESTRLFQLKITGAGRKTLFTFKIVCGPGDTAEPVLTDTQIARIIDEQTGLPALLEALEKIERAFWKQFANPIDEIKAIARATLLVSKKGAQ